MNKKMRELKEKMAQMAKNARTFAEEGDIDKAEKELSEIEKLQKQYEIEEKLFNAEKDEIKDELPTEEEINKSKKHDGFSIISKMLRKQSLTADEKQLVIDGQNGEKYLLPEDVNTSIRELRRNYVSAKDIVHVVPVSTLSGTVTYEAGNDGELTELNPDGTEVDASDDPKFTNKKWTIRFFAKLIPISRILQKHEKAGLLSYLNRWFIKKAINTENKLIFAELKKDKTAKPVKGWKALKRIINNDLDPSIKLTSFIVTNQTGFSILDEEEDENGRPILQPNPANPTEKVFQGLEVKVYSDKQLPNVSGKAPMFIGDTIEGCEFEELDSLEFAISEHFLFNKNQNCMRLIEGFGITQMDADAYIYATFEATPKPTPAA